MDPEKLQQQQILEQNLQQLLMQKQQFQSSLIENENALSELSKTDTAYKIIGSIMIKADKSELEKELKTRNETVSIRINNIDKQETMIKERLEKVKKEVLETKSE